MSKELGQAAYEAWHEAMGWENRWRNVTDEDRVAWAAAEQRGAERERAATVAWLRRKPMIGSHHMAADEVEAGKHRESEDE